MLKHIFLKNFRNFKASEISFSPGLNLIQGGNAQGKTNLLEAIYFLSTGKSFRTLHLKELIRHEEAFFYVEAHFEKEGVAHTIKASFDGQERKLDYDQTLSHSFVPLLGLLPTILYVPEDSALVAGGPAERRRLLDLHLAQQDPVYVHHLQRYYQAMKQRNNLLRQQIEETLTSWEGIMAEASQVILNKRRSLLSALKPTLEEALQTLSLGADRVEIHYQSTLKETSSFVEQYHKQRPREMALGSSLLGPHRDDLVFYLNGQPARTFSSEGQKRSLVAALRLAQWQQLKEQTGIPPLLGIDDFGVHLDGARYHAFQQRLLDQAQVFVTAPFFADKPAITIEGGALV